MVFDPTINPKIQENKKRSGGVFDPTVGMETPQKEPEKGFFQKAKSLVSGEGRRIEGIPEITSAKGPFKAAFGMLTSTSPEQQRDVISENFPGATFENDPYGNILANIPEQGQFYLNKPGLSAQDALTLAGQGTALLAGAKAGGAPFKGLLPKALGVGAGSGIGSIGLDFAAQLAGSEQGIDLPRAVVTAGGGALFEMAAPIFSAMWRQLTVGGKTPTVEAARGALKDLGYSAEDLTDEAIEQFIKNAKNATSKEAAATFAEAQTLPTPVPLKRGQVSGSANQQMFEDLAEKGAYGETSETLMRGASQRTEDALRENIPAIQTRLGRGTSRVTEPGEGLASVQGRLSGEAKVLKKSVGDAYELAETTVANIYPKGVKPLITKLQTDVGRVLRNAPAVRGEIKDLARLSNKNKPITANELFDWRKGMTDLSKNAPNATERLAAGRAVKAFDENIEDVISNSIMDGDSKAVSLWMDAISKRREFGNLFEGEKGADKLISMLVKQGDDDLTVDPQVVSKMIFGSKGSKLVSDPNSVRILSKFKNRLGKDSDEWLALKEEAFVTLMQAAEGAYAGGKRQFSGVNIKKAVDNMISQNPRAFRVLFDEGERKLIRQFVNVAARSTNPVKGGSNPSNTSVGLSRLVQSIGNALFMGERGRAILSRILPTAYEGVQMGRAAQAARGGLPLREIPAGVVGGAGATLTNIEAQ